MVITYSSFMISKKKSSKSWQWIPSHSGPIVNPLSNLPKIRTYRNISKHIQTLKIGLIIWPAYIKTLYIYDNYSICPYFCCSQHEKLCCNAASEKNQGHRPWRWWPAACAPWTLRPQGLAVRFSVHDDLLQIIPVNHSSE
jgi:hypothetical protein